jgi:hypothetical protein
MNIAVQQQNQLHYMSDCYSNVSQEVTQVAAAASK